MVILASGAGGTTGVGEIVRPLIYDTNELAKLEERLLHELYGLSLAALAQQIAEWRTQGKRAQGFVFGVELAMLDLMGCKLGTPVASLLGGMLAKNVPEYLSLSSEDPRQMAEVVARKGAGFPVIQAKLGIDDLETDLNRVRAVLAKMRPDQQLLADFNGALDPEDAIRALPTITDDRVIWEEPCFDYNDAVAVARAIQHPVMLDQCLKDLPTCAKAIQDGVAAALVIKSDSVGGLTQGRIVHDMCKQPMTAFRCQHCRFVWVARPIMRRRLMHQSLVRTRLM